MTYGPGLRVSGAGSTLVPKSVTRSHKILGLLLAGVAVFVLLNLWLNSGEDQKAYYETTEEATRDKVAGADPFERGWLPVVLKCGTNEIREEHNVSTNQGRATFHYTPLFADALARTCSPLPPDALLRTPFWRWPEFLHDGNTRVFKCGDFTLAIHDEKSGFFWH